MIQQIQRIWRLKQAEHLRYTLEDMKELHRDGDLNASDLTDEELEMAMNEGLLPWSAKNCLRLTRSGINLNLSK